MKPEIDYISDDDVDDALDRELRDLLMTCFTKPVDVAVFRQRRYCQEPVPHRWFISDEHGSIVAHIGVHEKTVEAGGQIYRIGGIAEVCVHPDYRRRGYVRMMLVRIHEWLGQGEFTFSVLFGRPEVYGSSGYVQVGNLIHGGAKEGWKQATAMVKEISATPWPPGKVYLPGPMF